MQIVPVVDLLAGHAVRAVRGDRANYQPVESSLCRGSDPLVVGRALLDHCAGNTLYIADLDALTGRGVQTPLLTELLQALPEVGIWLDAGFASPPEAAAILGALPEGGKRVVPVIASEALSAAESISEFTRRWPRALLSLDQRQGKALGAESCWTASHLWPQKIIVMTLDRVGSFEGPDLATVQEVQARAGSARTVIGAGGVRSVADLEAAARAGVEAWLIASALHDGRIPAGWSADH